MSAGPATAPPTYPTAPDLKKSRRDVPDDLSSGMSVSSPRKRGTGQPSPAPVGSPHDRGHTEPLVDRPARNGRDRAVHRHHAAWPERDAIGQQRQLVQQIARAAGVPRCGLAARLAIETDVSGHDDHDAEPLESRGENREQHRRKAQPAVVPAGVNARLSSCWETAEGVKSSAVAAAIVPRAATSRSTRVPRTSSTATAYARRKITHGAEAVSPARWRVRIRLCENLHVGFALDRRHLACPEKAGRVSSATDRRR